MTELVTAKKSKGEVLVFRRGHKPSQFKDGKSDTESGMPTSSGTSAIATKMGPGNTSDKGSGLIQMQSSVFHWW
jgi:ATP-binding cassette subfamily G (WHITE) protein 2 (PDR)